MFRAKMRLSTVVAFLSLCACGSSSSSPTPASSASPSPSPTASTTTSTTTDAACPSATAVVIENFAFNPNCIHVSAANGNVTFTNQDSTQHTATSDTGAAETFDSSALNQNDSFVHKFSTAGATVTGHCSYHPGMQFKVIVGD